MRSCTAIVRIVRGLELRIALLAIVLDGDLVASRRPRDARVLERETDDVTAIITLHEEAAAREAV